MCSSSSSALDDFLNSICDTKEIVSLIVIDDSDDDEEQIKRKKDSPPPISMFKYSQEKPVEIKRSIPRAPSDPTFSVKFGKSPMWMAVRLGSNDIAAALGYSQYESPYEVYDKKMKRKQGSKVVSTMSAEGQQACTHGKNFEKQTFNVFDTWLKGGRPDVEFDKLKHLFAGTNHRPSVFQITNWIHQKMKMENVHKVPDPTVHKLFTDSKDSNFFGATLDVEGDHIDCEIKNPLTLASFKKNYAGYITPQYFLQCQLQMAIRQRSAMFFVATHFNPVSKELEAMVIWYVVFNERFFTEVMYPKAKHFIQSANDLVPAASMQFDWINENGIYLGTENFQKDMMRFCYKIYYFLNEK